MAKVKEKIEQLSKFLTFPKKCQDFIHVQTIDINTGIFYHGDNVYTKQYTFDDVNFETLSEADKEDIVLKYSAFINAFATGGEFKVTLNNRRIDSETFGNACALRNNKDEFQPLRDEYNGIIKEKVVNSDGLDTQLILTLRVEAENFADAESQFQQMEYVAEQRLGDIESNLVSVSAKERLRILYSFYHRGEEWFFDDHILTDDDGKPVYNKRTGRIVRTGGFDLNEKQFGLYTFKDFKTFIAPNSMTIRPTYIVLEGNSEAEAKYARVLYVKDYSAYVSDNALYAALDIPASTCMSIDVKIINPAEAMKIVEKKLDAIEMNITKWQLSQNKSQNFSAEIPYKMRNQKNEVEAFMEDLNERDQCMCETCITVFLLADSLEELESETQLITKNAKRGGMELALPKFQQIEAFNTAIPLGINEMRHKRTLTTESLAIQMPFKTQNIMHDGGLYYGVNPLSKKIISVNRYKLPNFNSFILGMSGSGKSTFAKLEILSTALQGETDIIIIDPEREYSPVVKKIGGEVIRLSSVGDVHINAMECSAEYGEREDGSYANPVSAKSEFILSLLAKINGAPLGPDEKSIVDRVMRKIFKNYERKRFNNEKAVSPTLADLREELEKQKEDAAHRIATALEIFTEGSLNLFGQQNNVDIHNRIVCYDMYDLGSQLKPLAMLVTLDNIQNRIAENRAKGKNTAIYIDELYLMFQDEGSSEFLMNLWKRVRKYNAYMVGITQNIADIMRSVEAKNMLGNSSFLVLLGQSDEDFPQIRDLLGLSERQTPYIHHSKKGEGLLKVGSTVIPFENVLSNKGQIYELVTTDEKNKDRALDD